MQKIQLEGFFKPQMPQKRPKNLYLSKLRLFSALIHTLANGLSLIFGPQESSQSLIWRFIKKKTCKYLLFQQRIPKPIFFLHLHILKSLALHLKRFKFSRFGAYIRGK